MTVGAIIVTYNSRDTIGRCLSSLETESLISSIVVVDNASRDGTPDLVPFDYLIGNDENRGFAAGVNQGIQRLGEGIEWLLVMNPDGWVVPGATSEMVCAIESDSRAGAAGPKTLNPDGSDFPSAWPLPNAAVWLLLRLRLARLFPSFIRRRLFQSFYTPTSGRAMRVGWVFGACILVKRTIWEELGGFDERYFLSGEELDFFWRARKAGWKCLYVPEAIFYHLRGHSAETEFGVEGWSARKQAVTLEVCRTHMSPWHYRIFRTMWKRSRV